MKDLISGKSPLPQSAPSRSPRWTSSRAATAQSTAGAVGYRQREAQGRRLSTKGFLDYSADHMPFKHTGIDYFNTDTFEAGLDGPEPISSRVLPESGSEFPARLHTPSELFRAGHGHVPALDQRHPRDPRAQVVLRRQSLRDEDKIHGPRPESREQVANLRQGHLEAILQQQVRPLVHQVNSHRPGLQPVRSVTT